MRLPKRLMTYLFAELGLYAMRHEPTQIITDGTGENRTYLRRWKIVNSAWWHPGIYLHNMILNDDSALHDHPYASLSLVLTNGLTEHYQKSPRFGDTVYTRTLYAGDVIWRSSKFAHQLTVDQHRAWTLFIPMFRLPKGWGFYCPRGYTKMEVYHETRRAALRDGVTGSLIGCGE